MIRRDQVERSRTNWSFHDSGWPGTETHLPDARELIHVLQTDLCAHTGERAHEVINHAVGIGMIDIKSIEFAVGRQINTCLALHVKYHARGIQERLLDDTGAVRRFVNVYVNEEDIRFLENQHTPIKDGDEFSIIPAIAGG